MPDSLTRHLALAGASNFRDLGGYPARDGRLVRWRRLFRSSHLGDLTVPDIELLRGLGLKSAFDLRGIEERLSSACCDDTITVHSLPIEPSVLVALKTRLLSSEPLTGAETAALMRESYRGFVQENTPAFRTLFTHLLRDDGPLVIHCTAGKDRTGFACALILNALGVSEDLVVEDYLLTNRHYRIDPATARSIDLPDDVKAVLISVEGSFLAAAFEAVQASYGGVDAYLADGLGIGPRERAALEQRYLES
ncbi:MULTISPECIES: tyrosine-protein phosphatase [Rhodopseudomonas]|uniref:Protein tyrosine phosphatase n=1 Tax=Rhodopseudomonas palustris TaxID=1076 RepID=A0A0D7EMC6_RHOPL|nr:MULTISPECIES: tyrosine-protein phosphatase [Rhodopseudomonas]KIZ41796.1 protein tyrosine phosphatase [Rhodopseudomonas palustris]MDF3810852.1 tyrosine-protein phosphatase [Rhodopseudomonas sp. BAL398]WOK19227.1 tyrosine-protein phosphatase [Rhodopseudomonas sp. BAL398]